MEYRKPGRRQAATQQVQEANRRHKEQHEAQNVRSGIDPGQTPRSDPRRPRSSVLLQAAHASAGGSAAASAGGSGRKDRHNADRSTA
jgi:hypothetical protein